MVTLAISFILGVQLVAPCLGIITTPTKEPRAYCLNDGDTLWSRFILDENNDPAGDLVETVMANYMRVENNVCNIVRDGTVLYFDVKVPLSANGVSENENCFRITGSDPSGFDYMEFYLLHQTVRDGFVEIVRDIDRVYNWKCRFDIPVNLKITASIISNNPNIQRPIAPSPLPVELTVWKQTGQTANNNPVFEQIDPNVPEPAGLAIRMHLSFSLASNYTDFIDAYGVRGFNLMVMGAGQSFLLIGPEGCPEDNVPFPFPSAFTFNNRLSDGNSYVMTTGMTRLYGFERSNPTSVTYMVYFSPCFDVNNRQRCENMCEYETNIRKREAEKDQTVYTAQFTVQLQRDQPEEKQGVASKTMIIATSVSMAALLIVILGLVICVAVMHKRRRDESGSQYSKNKLQLPAF